MRSRELIRKRISAGLCTQCGKRPPVAGQHRCKACAEKNREWQRAYYERQKRKGGNVEPQCRPAKGPMREAHDWDDDTSLCTACGVKRAEATPPAAPPRHERPIVGAAAGLTRQPGGRSKPGPLQRVPVYSDKATPKPQAPALIGASLDVSLRAAREQLLADREATSARLVHIDATITALDALLDGGVS